MNKTKAAEILFAKVRSEEDQAESVGRAVSAYLCRHQVKVVEAPVVWRDHTTFVAVHHRSTPSPRLDSLLGQAEKIAEVAHAKHQPRFAA